MWGPNRVWLGSGLVLGCLGPGFTVPVGEKPIISTIRTWVTHWLLLFGLGGVTLGPLPSAPAPAACPNSSHPKPKRKRHITCCSSTSLRECAHFQSAGYTADLRRGWRDAGWRDAGWQDARWHVHALAAGHTWWWCKQFVEQVQHTVHVTPITMTC